MLNAIVARTERKMKRLILVICLLPICVCSVFAQEMPEPTKHHKWLAKFVGQWDATSKGSMGDGQPAVESKGTMESKMLGGFWLTSTMKADVSGMPFTGVQTIGYSSKKRKYVGTWIDSMNDYMWQYEGFVDESGKKLVLEATGPDMMEPGKTRKYRDAYEFKTDDELKVTSSVENEDGSWTTFMEGTSKRVKESNKGSAK